MVRMSEILTYVHELAERFAPLRIVLFGSYAYGRPTEDSDVDLLVVMRHRGPAYSQATRIRCSMGAPFAMDLLIRSPEELNKQIALGDQLIIEILKRGRVLYDAGDKAVGAKSRGRLQSRGTRNAGGQRRKLRRRVLSLPAVH
jgi:predicted nucleotidyltransferase